MPSICLVYGLGVALGGLRRLASISAFCFRLALPPAHALGERARTPGNRQDLPVAALHQLWQDGVGMNESEKQFSFTRAALSTSGARKTKSPSVARTQFQSPV